MISIEFKEYLRLAMYELCGNLPKNYIYMNTGWRKVQNEYMFAHSVGSVGGKEISVELDSALENYRLCEQNFDTETMNPAVFIDVG